jgi:hypothetical protein
MPLPVCRRLGEVISHGEDAGLCGLHPVHNTGFKLIVHCDITNVFYWIFFPGEFDRSVIEIKCIYQAA